MRRPSFFLCMVTPLSMRSTIPRVRETLYFFLMTDAASIERSVGTKHSLGAGEPAASDDKTTVM